MLKTTSRRLIRKSHTGVHTAQQTDAGKARLNLLDDICNSIMPAKEQMPVIATINEMTRYTLNASAAAVLSREGETSPAIDKFSDSPLGQQFSQVQTPKELGIAGRVMQTGKPVLIRDTSQDERFNQYRDEVPGLVARSVICAPLVFQGKIIGAVEALNKLDGNDFNEQDLQTLAGLAAGAALTIANIRANENLLYSYKRTVQKLVSLADARESTESKHSIRVSKYALIGASELNLSPEEKEIIEYGSILHDIGLLGVPPEILKKREALTKEDWSIIRKHSVIGYNLLRGIPALNEVSKLILYHHERFDGKGYPCGLKGETIPVGARLISVADAFDSMTVKHSYRAASSVKDAIRELGKCSGTQFCPAAVKALSLGYIKTNSLSGVMVKKEHAVNENWRTKPGDGKIWPIAFNRNAHQVKSEEPAYD
ncbi:MAG: HD domain-containing phosphohydrolase [Dehalococcoidales bacterium]|jgi:HD-GYP domain-containing protein (c-di-GMP phosphodiesterase class II)